MKTLLIKEEYGDQAEQILKAAFGPDALKISEKTEGKPTSINSFEDVMAINGATKQPVFTAFEDENDRSYQMAVWDWEQIVKAYNKLRDPNFVVDWLNDDQYKYWPYAILKADKSKPTGFAFSYTGYYCTDTTTYVGSRLCFAHEDDVLDALKKFEQIYIRTRLY